MKTQSITIQEFADISEALEDCIITYEGTMTAHEGIHPQLGSVVIIAGTNDDALLITKQAA